jgi:predicted ATPase with chaperone activity
MTTSRNLESSTDNEAGSGWLLKQMLHPEPRSRAKSSVAASTTHEPFFPSRPQSIEDLDIRIRDVRSLILQLLLQRNGQFGTGLAESLRIPLRILEPQLKELRDERLLDIRKSTGSHDFEFALTDLGYTHARRDAERSTYCEAAPVSYRQYVESVERQSPCRARITPENLERALADLQLAPALTSRLGRAVTGGRAMFLCGPPGNGKTSIAERIVRAYSDTIWIPYAISFGGDIVRLYDPLVHHAVPETSSVRNAVDERWIRIRRPAVVAGGELDLSATLFRRDEQTGLLQAPLHLKSNGGVLVIDDFGRQRVHPDELLNRWIVPLESRVDYLPLPSGRSFRVPFEQFLVLSTNLQPSQLVDEAYLRRIPYKVEVPGPTPDVFLRLFLAMATKLGLTLADPHIAEHLIQQHFSAANRTLRFCHARDLLVLVQHHCEYHGLPAVVTEPLLDEAVATYFFQAE